MACDRPLAKLDPDMGGFIPGPHMPISVSMEPSKNIGVMPSVKEGPGGRTGAARKGPPPAQHSRSVVHSQHPHSGLLGLLLSTSLNQACKLPCHFLSSAVYLYG